MDQLEEKWRYFEPMKLQDWPIFVNVPLISYSFGAILTSPVWWSPSPLFNYERVDVRLPTWNTSYCTNEKNTKLNKVIQLNRLIMSPLITNYSAINQQYNSLLDNPVWGAQFTRKLNLCEWNSLTNSSTNSSANSLSSGMKFTLIRVDLKNLHPMSGTVS